MVASIKPYADELGLSDGLMLIGGRWVPAADGASWSHPHPATGERVANDTSYGLSATVWTSDLRRAMRVTKSLRVGTVGINGYQVEPHWPFGGYRGSGLGREGGRAAIESYTELKTVLLPLSDEMM